MSAEDLRRLQHPRFARSYVRFSRLAERRGVAAHRERLLSGLSGRVMEVGAGNGLNFCHYPPRVTEVIAVEPDATLRAHALAAAQTAGVPVTVVAGHVEALPSVDGDFDAAVVSLVLCSVPDQERGLAEIHRVLRHGGELRFYEHVRSARRWVAAMQDAVTPVFRRAAGGCHPNRDTVAAIEAAGFQIDTVDRFGFSPGAGVPRLPHVLGRAHRL